MIRLGMILLLTPFLGCGIIDGSFSPWDTCQSQNDCGNFQICTVVETEEEPICLQECASNVPCTPGYECTPLVTLTRHVCIYTGIWDE